MHRNPAWSYNTTSIHQFCSLVDHTKPQTHTHTLTHLEQAFVLLSFWNPGIVVKKLLTPCCFLLSVSTPPLLLLFSHFPLFYFFQFLVSSTDLSQFSTDLMSSIILPLILSISPSIYLNFPLFFLFVPSFPSFHLSLHHHFLVLSSLQFVLNQVPRLQWSIRVTAMQRAVQSLDQPLSVPRALTQGESMLHKVNRTVTLCCC